ncbi:MAG: MazG nucleotide pyrophosphohydrolase domain-containing protein [Actinomycetota bacterium]
MNINDYQVQAGETDVLTGGGDLLPLLGLAGEVGQLIAEYKKRERDKTGYRAFREEVHEELGDILWYAAALARYNGFDLGEIAQSNLTKTRGLFLAPERLSPQERLDKDAPADQQLPAWLTVTFVETQETTDRGETLQRVRMFRGDQPVGDPLDDNSEHNDNYRYHDVFHLAHMAVLGWSPVLRRLLRCKRAELPSVDRVQDGGRAAAIEEGLTAYVFTVAAEHSFFTSLAHVPPSVLKTCMKMTSHLEVAARSAADWHATILAGYEVFRQVVANRGGVLTAHLEDRTLTYARPLPGTVATP